MESFAAGRFQQLAAATSGEAAVQLLFQNPVLLAEWRHLGFYEWIQQCPPAMQPPALHALRYLAQVTAQTTNDLRTYPLGSGPLEPIIRQLTRGEITATYASELASDPEVYRNLSPVYVRALSMAHQAEANQDDWRKPLLGQKVILAALDARKVESLPDQQIIEMIACIDYAVIVARSVREFPDGRLFTDAVRRTTHLLDTQTAPWHTPGEVEFSLGVLHLDPYISKRTTANFERQMEEWQRQPFDTLAGKLNEEERKAIRLPSPKEALKASSDYFHRSAEKREGTDRGLSLKGYIEAEVWKKIAGGTAADGLVAVAREASSLLPGERYEGVRAAIDGLIGYSQGIAGEGWKDAASRLLATETKELIERRGLIEATDLLTNVAGAASGESPETALALWRKAFPAMLLRDESARKGFFELGLTYIRRGKTEVKDGQFEEGSPLQLAEACRQQAAKLHWPAERLAATLLSIAVRSQVGDREAEGVQVLQQATEADVGFAAELMPLFYWHAAILYRGKASNAFFADQFAEAIRSYASAARRFLDAMMPGEADQMLLLASDVVNKSIQNLPEFAVYFGTVIPELERQGGAPVIRRIRDICRKFLPMLAKNGQVNTVLLTLLLDAVKGSAFNAALRAGGSFDWIDSSASRRLLAHIEEARGEPGAFDVETAASALSEEDLLTMYAEEEEQVAGGSPAAVLHNLEIRYESELRRQMGTRIAPGETWSSIPANIRAELGSESVLMTYYSGVAPNGNAGLYVTTFTKEATAGAILDLGIPAMTVIMNEVQADILAVGVTSARVAVNEEPEDGVASSKAREALARDAGFVGGPTESMLKQLRKDGKWHLCIQPHGPLHFYPFHLLPYDGGILADQWVITYLPNIALLDPARREQPERPLAIASFGMEFRGEQPHGLPELPGAEDEARMVAEAFGAAPLLGPSATETTLADALRHARRIHIATHGLHAVSAPSFQRVYLTPDADSDGVLYAYELLRHDLRGLDLLTLSACETALGRIDIGDNLRGLPANALIAGAATVIGTLWPVENATARTFFGALYKELAGGIGKREAFRAAQLAAREKHPQYRDWGAFTYSGQG